MMGSPPINEHAPGSLYRHPPSELAGAAHKTSASNLYRSMWPGVLEKVGVAYPSFAVIT